MTKEIKHAERMREINNYVVKRRNSLPARIVSLLCKKVMVFTKKI
jgi:23S rRNA maturation-related 3'-5' exoribonuclease YhaM